MTVAWISPEHPNKTTTLGGCWCNERLRTVMTPSACGLFGAQARCRISSQVGKVYFWSLICARVGVLNVYCIISSWRFVEITQVLPKVHYWEVWSGLIFWCSYNMLYFPFISWTSSSCHGFGFCFPPPKCFQFLYCAGVPVKAPLKYKASLEKPSVCGFHGPVS